MKNTRSILDAVERRIGDAFSRKNIRAHFRTVVMGQALALERDEWARERHLQVLDIRERESGAVIAAIRHRLRCPCLGGTRRGLKAALIAERRLLKIKRVARRFSMAAE